MSAGSVVLALIAAFIISGLLTAVGLVLTGFEWVLLFAVITAAVLGFIYFWRRRSISSSDPS